jgi:hypothetical protein
MPCMRGVAGLNGMLAAYEARWEAWVAFLEGETCRLARRGGAGGTAGTGRYESRASAR